MAGDLPSSFWPVGYVPPAPAAVTSRLTGSPGWPTADPHILSSAEAVVHGRLDVVAKGIEEVLTTLAKSHDNGAKDFVIDDMTQEERKIVKTLFRNHFAFLERSFQDYAKALEIKAHVTVTAVPGATMYLQATEFKTVLKINAHHDKEDKKKIGPGGERLVRLVESLSLSAGRTLFQTAVTLFKSDVAAPSDSTGHMSDGSYQTSGRNEEWDDSGESLDGHTCVVW